MVSIDKTQEDFTISSLSNCQPCSKMIKYTLLIRTHTPHKNWINTSLTKVSRIRSWLLELLLGKHSAKGLFRVLFFLNKSTRRKIIERLFLSWQGSTLDNVRVHMCVKGLLINYWQREKKVSFC